MSEQRLIIEQVRHPLGRVIERTVPVVRHAKVRLRVVSVDTELEGGKFYVTRVERIKDEGNVNDKTND